ncbi:thiamine pyrophosphate-dependent enzyme [Enterovirga sp.]|jgi:thiamine pyrophosphate-dependent acetolactate synthase large subunit-like protein|uniref:thiamine pyrophosphate-dependent enzyme n=1 Tax=Enterovirga sp. TaxID=2026350 RepID=UPI0026174693|nr:thiamine pyrophosphate-dependent enzyme [Enterovirga sp.]MDB5592705.1 aldehyde dehydrogenase [Enterovirga sp.]
MADATLDRRPAVAALLKDRGDLLVVTGLGSPSYDVHAAGDHPGNCYLWGAMGGAALVGLGLAQAQPSRTVLVITGDGEQLMGIGGLATIAIAKPKNLVLCVLDNGHFGETGMQRSHTGLGLDLAAVGRACGLAAETVTDMAGIEGIRSRLHERRDGPALFVVRVRAENVSRSLPARDAVYLKNRVRGSLGLPVS